MALFNALPKYCNDSREVWISGLGTEDRTQIFPDRKKGYIFSGDVRSEIMILVSVLVY
jgi:hypothetical protein